ncbi:MAG: hypothetical protein CM15mP128_2720 [Methanobacteriota archaeon]|nr:MAG: hypothetical protein CM15mP128_2720 [Euryarchaeota archaeon]
MPLAALLNQLDSDNDGVKDHQDRCPNTLISEPSTLLAATSQQQNVDSDEDGVRDADDLCALTPVGASADADGCAASQRDSDNDGVADDLDLCPASKAGFPVDATGCLDETACEDDLDGDGVAGCPAWEDGSDGLCVKQKAVTPSLMPRSGTTPMVTGAATTSAETKAMPVRRRRGTLPAVFLANNLGPLRMLRMTATDSWTNLPEDPTQWLDEDRTDTATPTPQDKPDPCTDTAPGDRNRGHQRLRAHPAGHGRRWRERQSDQCPDEPLAPTVSRTKPSCCFPRRRQRNLIEVFGQP